MHELSDIKELGKFVVRTLEMRMNLRRGKGIRTGERTKKCKESY